MSRGECDRSAILEQVLRDHSDLFPDDVPLAVTRSQAIVRCLSPDAERPFRI